MSVGILVCDGCNRTSDNCDCLIEFRNHIGQSFHLCDECIELAYETIDMHRSGGPLDIDEKEDRS